MSHRFDRFTFARPALYLALALIGYESPGDTLWRIGVASDYVHRGLLHTRHGPAYQVAIEHSWASGLYAGVWSSRVDYRAEDSRDIELDVFVGYSREIATGAGLEFTATRYTYPGDAHARRYDWSEVHATLHIADYWAVRAGVTRGWLGRDHDLPFMQTTFRYPAPLALVTDITVGYYDADAALGFGYGYLDVGLSRAFGNLSGRISFTSTQERARGLYGDAGASRFIVAAIWTM